MRKRFSIQYLISCKKYIFYIPILDSIALGLIKYTYAFLKLTIEAIVQLLCPVNPHI